MTDITIYKANKRCVVFANTGEARLQFSIWWNDHKETKDGHMYVHRNADVIDDLVKDLNAAGLSVEIK